MVGWITSSPQQKAQTFGFLTAYLWHNSKVPSESPLSQRLSDNYRGTMQHVNSVIVRQKNIPYLRNTQSNHRSEDHLEGQRYMSHFELSNQNEQFKRGIHIVALMKWSCHNSESQHEPTIVLDRSGRLARWNGAYGSGWEKKGLTSSFSALWTVWKYNWYYHGPAWISVLDDPHFKIHFCKGSLPSPQVSNLPQKPLPPIITPQNYRGTKQSIN